MIPVGNCTLLRAEPEGVAAGGRPVDGVGQVAESGSAELPPQDLDHAADGVVGAACPVPDVVEQVARGRRSGPGLRASRARKRNGRVLPRKQVRPRKVTVNRDRSMTGCGWSAGGSECRRPAEVVERVEGQLFAEEGVRPLHDLQGGGVSLSQACGGSRRIESRRSVFMSGPGVR